MVDIVKTYFEEICNNKSLTKSETHELALRAQTGDEKATEKLVKHHLLLVVKIAREYMGKGVDFSELIAEGNAGLLTSISKWSAEKGASFTTCASWYIKQSIIRNCMHNNRIVRLPEHISELMKDGRIDYTYSQVHIDKPNEEGNTLAETLHEKNEFDIFSSEEDMLSAKKIETFLSMLKVKEREVIELSYGLNGKEQMDICQIAEHFSLTTTRINQIIRSSIRKMQEKKDEI